MTDLAMATEETPGLRHLIVDWPEVLESWAKLLASEGRPSESEAWLAARAMCGAADDMRRKQQRK